MLGVQGLWARRDYYRTTPAVTWGLVFSGLIRRIAQFCRLLRHTRGCGGPNITRILTEFQRTVLLIAKQAHRQMKSLISARECLYKVEIRLKILIRWIACSTKTRYRLIPLSIFFQCHLIFSGWRRYCADEKVVTIGYLLGYILLPKR